MHQNNFDFLRLLFAVLVIITHSWPAALGVPHEYDWFGQWNDKQLNLSGIGLSGFFSISGYLIYKSLIRSKSLGNYFLKRCLRIFPGFLGALIVTAVGSYFLSDYSFAAYFTSPEPYTYVLYNLNLFTKERPTILDSLAGHPYGNNNPSIWTIRYEFLFYIGTAALFFIPAKWYKPLLMGAFVFLWYRIFMGSSWFFTEGHYFYSSAFYLYYVAYFGLFFLGGALLATAKIENWPRPNLLLILSLIGVGLSLYFHVYKYTAGVFMPVAIILLGLKNTPGISGWGKKYGDFSFGAYLYGFPIKQVLIHYYDLTPVQLMLLAVPLAIFAGFLSWHLVEKQFLRFKLKRTLSLSPSGPAIV